MKPIYERLARLAKRRTAKRHNLTHKIIGIQMLVSSKKIRRMALAAGFSLCGIARARTLDERVEPLRRWLDAGMESGMGYMRRAPERRTNPQALVEGAKTVVVCAANYKNAAWNQSLNPKIASYAYARDYHATIKKMLGEVLAGLPEARGRCFCDTAPLLEKAWAVEAGLGWVGKNSLLVTPSHGSFVLLGELILDAECDEYDSPLLHDGCGGCTRCMEACPNSAIVAPRTIDTRRCISRLTLEKGAECGPDDLHGWIAGCDECQSCCPHNQKSPLCDDPRFAPVVPVPAPPAFWRTLTAERFDTLFADTPLARRGFEVLKNMIK